MLKAKFSFTNYYVVCKQGEKAVSNVTYFTDSTGMTALDPQPTVGSTLSFPTFKTWTTETTDIIADSLEIDISRLSGLKSSSNTASLTLRRQPFFDYTTEKRTLIGVISEGRYTAEVKIYNDNTCLFTGCLLPSSTSWNVTVNGNSDVSIHLYDITALRMKRRFSTEPFDYVTYNGTLDDLVQECCDVANLTTVSSELTPLSSYSVVSKIDTSDTVQDVMEQALYEHNYVFYTDADGVLHVQKIEVDGDSEYNIWSSDDSPSYEEGDPLLYRHGNTAIQRRVNRPNNYKEALVSMIPLEPIDDLKVYEVSSNDGKDPYTLSARSAWNGYSTFETLVESGSLPTIEQSSSKSAGLGSHYMRWALTVPSGSDWDTIVIKAKAEKTGLFNGGYWGTSAYIAHKTTITTTTTQYDDEGEPYEVTESYDEYNRVTNEIGLGDEWEQELVFELNSGESCTQGNLYFCVQKETGWGKCTTTLNPDKTSSSYAIRYVGSKTDATPSSSKVTLANYETGTPIWWLGDLYTNSDPNTYDSLITYQSGYRACSTVTTFLIDNSRGNSPVSAKWRLFARKSWVATTTDEYPQVLTAHIDGMTEGESYSERAYYSHDDGVVGEHANLVAKIMSMNSCTYTFYTDELIEPLTVVTVHDNMWSAMKQKMIITGRSKKYKNGTVYKYTASAITPSEYIKVRYPSARYNQIPVDRPRDGEDGKSSLYFGSLSWTQAQVDAHIVGSNYNFTNTLGVSVKTGDTIWIDILNTTTGLRATLNCLVLSVTSGTPYAKVISYLWEGKDGKDGADGGEYSVQITGSSNYSRNKRTGGNQTLQYIASFKGYNPITDTVTITSDSTQATITKGTATTTTQPFTLSIAYTNTVNSIKVTVNVSHTVGSKTWTDFATATLSVVEDTEYYKYFGALSSAPSSYVIQGDFYFNTSNNLPYYYKGTGWVGFSDSSVPQDRISIMCSEMQKDALERVPVGTVTSSEWGYFRNIIAGTVTANYIKSQTGVFDGITVTNADIQNADIDNVNVTNANVSGDFVGNKVYIKALRGISLTPQTRYFESELVRGNVPCVTMAEWRAVFPFDGCYLITSGKINGQTITQGNITFGQWEGHSEGTIFGTIGTYMYKFGDFFCSNENNTLVYMPNGAFENLAGPSTVTVPSVMPSIDVKDPWDSTIQSGGYIGTSQRPWAQIWGREVHGAVFN